MLEERWCMPKFMHSVFIRVILIGAIGLFCFELWIFVPHLENFAPTDYAILLQYGRDVQTGNYNGYYPLPTALWIFLPLSLLPPWFAVLWTVIPFAILLWLFRRKGVVLWLFVPVLVQAAWGQLDGYLLIPLYWLLNGNAVLAPISAGLLLLKPQFALLPVPFAVYRWLRRRNWKSLGLFAATTIILYVPSFFVDPFWVIRYVPVMQERITGVSYLPQRTATLWGWWWRGDWAIWVLPFLVVLCVMLFVRAWQSEQQRTKALHLLGLLVQPVYFVVSLVTVVSTLNQNTRQLIAITVISWIAFGLDAVLAWGGVYVIISLMALWFLGKNGLENVSE